MEMRAGAYPWSLAPVITDSLSTSCTCSLMRLLSKAASSSGFIDPYRYHLRQLRSRVYSLFLLLYNELQADDSACANSKRR